MASRERDFFKTDIEALRPLRGSRTAEWPAAAPKGLSLRANLSKDGSVTRAWQSRFTRPGGGAGRIVYGHWPTMSVEDAVAAHRDARDLLAQGVDPTEARAAEKVRLAGRATLSDAFADYCTSSKGQKLAPKTLKEYQRLMKAHVLPAIGDEAVADITPTMIKTLLRREIAAYEAREKARDAAAKAAGRERPKRGGNFGLKLHNALGAFFSWAVSASVELVEVSPVPVRKVMGYAPEKADPRPLLRSELEPFWAGVEGAKMTPRTKAALRLLLLTGARANELLNLQRKDIHFNGEIIDANADGTATKIGVGYIELRTTKGGKPRLVPLVDTSRAILAELLRDTPNEPGAYVFPNKADNSRPMLVTSLDRAVSRALPTLGLQKEKRAFTPHCLRSTTATLAQLHGHSEETAGLVLGHAKKSVTGQSYTKEEFLAQKYRALLSVEAALLRSIGIGADDTQNAEVAQHG
jgi:integrase